MPIGGAQAHVSDSARAWPAGRGPLLPDGAEREAAVARMAGATASIANAGAEQEGEERAADDAPAAKRQRVLVSVAMLELY